MVFIKVTPVSRASSWAIARFLNSPSLLVRFDHVARIIVNANHGIV
jgi:hypothetical protein